MFLIGLASVSAVIYGLIRAVYTGRWKNLLLWLWSVPLLGMVYFSSSDITINGLVVLIGIAMMFLIIYSLSGYAMWNVNVRDKKHGFKFIFFILMLIISMYFFYQCFNNGYLNFGLNEKLLSSAVLLISVVAALLMNSILMTAFDKYFSKKGTFIIIKCTPVKKKLNFFSSSAIRGVNNGAEYKFYADKLYFYLFKNEKNFKFSVKNGVLGGIYVLNNFSNHERKKRRIKKLLRNRALFVLLAFVLVVLLIFKLKMRMDFETIIITVMQAIFGRKL
jgi:hypothetical protein